MILIINFLHFIKGDLKESQTLDILNYGKHNYKENTLSLVVFYDGANFTNSNKSSFWAMFSIIADLPPIVRFRYSNIISHFIISSSQVDINKYSYKHSSELEKLICNGLEISGFGKVNIRIIGMICDTVARSKVLYTIQFNGKYGCIQCLHPGKTLPNSRKVVYPFSSTIGNLQVP